MSKRHFFFNLKNRKIYLILPAIVVLVIILCFTIRHFLGDWIQKHNQSMTRDMLVKTIDLPNITTQIPYLPQHDLKKFGKKIRAQVAQEFVLVNKIPTKSISESNNTAQKNTSSDQNTIDSLRKQLEMEAFSIPTYGRRLAIFRYHYPSTQNHAMTYGTIIYGYADDNTMKRISCYDHDPISLTQGSCAKEIEKVFHGQI